MEVITSVSEMRDYCRGLQQQGATLGFVPTMGHLHVGHATLLQRSIDENDATVMSIFINPTQFNNPEDLQQYPRTFEQDCIAVQDMAVDVIFSPEYEDIYPDDFNYQVSEHQLSTIMEGQHRPGHFTGVLTVLLKLLSLIKPHRIYMGEKDYQQVALVKGMVDAFFLETEVVSCPLIRDSKGLPCSSRNGQLSAAALARAHRFIQCFHQNKSCAAITQELEGLGVEVEYIQDYAGRRFSAVNIDGVRLLDHIPLSSQETETC